MASRLLCRRIGASNFSLIKYNHRHTAHSLVANNVQYKTAVATKPIGLRHSSHSAMKVPDMNTRKKVTMQSLRKLHRQGEPIVALTAYDFPSGLLADTAGVEIVIVGDSLAMVSLGMEDTTELVMDEMLVHCRSVSRAVGSAFTIADLPMGSYEASPEQAVKSAIRIVKEGRMMGVKMEGGQEMAESVKRITKAGIPVMAHIGLTPQRSNLLGGFRVQGKTVEGATKLLDDALAVQEAGASMILIEAVPAEVATLVTSQVRIPTIGIGSGNGCSGQVLVQTDMLGNFPPGRHVPRFVKTYADVWKEAMKGIGEYRQDVKSREFPSKDYTYPVPEEALAAIKHALSKV